MGNVFAKTASDAQSDPLKNASEFNTVDPITTAPPLTTASDLLATKKSDRTWRGHLSNPGTVDELHRKYRELLPASFVGLKTLLNRRYTKDLQLCHIFHLGSDEESTYRLLGTYGGSSQCTSPEAYPVLMGEIDQQGTVAATLEHYFTPQLRCKFFTQMMRCEEVVGQLTTEYCGDSFTASLTIANPNVIENSALFIGQYLQAITENLALGAEIVYHYGPCVIGGQTSDVSANGRYTCGNSVWSGAISNNGTQVCFYQKLSEQLKVGVEFETNSLGDTLALTCYQVNIPKHNVTFRGSIDSCWNLCGVIETRLQPMPFVLALSGRLNRSMGYFRLGLGLNIE